MAGTGVAPSRTSNVVALMEADDIASEKVAVTVPAITRPLEPAAGVTEATVGSRESVAAPTVMSVWSSVWLRARL